MPARACAVQQRGHVRRIRVGRRNAEQLEIIAGLAAGERVITSDYQGYGGIDRIELQ